MWRLVVLLTCLTAVTADITGKTLLSRIPKDHVPNWGLKLDQDGNTYLIDLNPLKGDAAPMFNARTETFFLLYTRQNPTTPQVLTFGNAESVRNSNFNPALPTRYIAHGWNSDRKSGVNVDVTAAYLSVGDYNIVVIDWAEGANNLIYTISRNRIFGVAEFAADFIDWMSAEFGAPVSNVHVMGHSLGGHISGLIGKHVKSGRIPVIIGLDPAGVGFDEKDAHERITPDDGEYVEIIHTNGGTLGYSKPCGDSDFYPNYGKGQPGCTLDVAGTCAHSRAWMFYAESIVSELGFIGNRCGSYTEVDKKKCVPDGTMAFMGGEPTGYKPHGSYHLETNKKEPFAQG